MFLSVSIAKALVEGKPSRSNKFIRSAKVFAFGKGINWNKIRIGIR